MQFKVYDLTTGAEVEVGASIHRINDGSTGILVGASRANDGKGDGSVMVKWDESAWPQPRFAADYGLRVEQAPMSDEDLTHIDTLAKVVANQLIKLVEIPEGRRYAAMRRIIDNVDTLKQWVGDDRFSIRREV